MVAAGEGPELGDAFGCALSDMHAGRPGAILVERDDGLLEVDASDYLSGWSDHDTRELERASGRATLVVSDRGQEVVALDVSPGAVEVCRRRGVIAGACIDPCQTRRPVHLATTSATGARGECRARSRSGSGISGWPQTGLTCSGSHSPKLDAIAAAGWRVTGALPGAEYRAALART